MLRAVAGCIVAASALFTVQPSALAAAKPSPSPAPQKVTFGIQPASATDTDSRPFLSYNVSAGVTLDDHVAVVNDSLTPVTLNVYATDAFNLADGGFGLLAAADKPKDAGSWVTLPQAAQSITVPGRGTEKTPPTKVVVPFHLEVPQTAIPGDHVAGIVAVLTTVTKDSKGANVRLDQRVGTRMYLRVSGPLHATLAVEHLNVTYHNNLNPIGAGSATVTYTVHNVGNVKLGSHQAVAIKGLFGASAKAAKVPDLPLLFPGSSVNVTVQVAHVWPTIRAKATVTLVPERLQGDADPALPSVNASTSFWAVPWVLLAIIVVLLLAGYLERRRRRRRRRRPARPAKPAQPVTATAAPTPAPAPVVEPISLPPVPTPEPTPVAVAAPVVEPEPVVTLPPTTPVSPPAEEDLDPRSRVEQLLAEIKTSTPTPVPGEQP